jgi:hypothetical protein
MVTWHVAARLCLIPIGAAVLVWGVWAKWRGR